MSKLVIIQGHPDPKQNHLDHALIASYIEGARTANHQVTLINIAELEFPLLQSNESFLKGKEDTPENLKPVQNAITESDHIVGVKNRRTGPFLSGRAGGFCDAW